MTVNHDTNATLEELRSAYRAQIDRLAAERDEARRQARKAKADAINARADLASLKDQVHELLRAVSTQLDAADDRSRRYQIEQPRLEKRPRPEKQPKALTR